MSSDYSEHPDVRYQADFGSLLRLRFGNPTVVLIDILPTDLPAIVISGASLDFSDPDNSGYLALLEDI